MRDLKEKDLQKLNFQIFFYFRYVDDIAIAVPPSSVNDILKVFNGFYPRLQFTVKIGKNQLNFLDVNIIKD